MSGLKTKWPTDIWVAATWEEFIAMADDPAYNKAKCYYRNGQMRIETISVGPDHSRDNAIALLAINLFCIIKGISLNGTVATGKQESESVSQTYLTTLDRERN